MPTVLPTIARALFVLASFAGLCAAIRVRLGIDRFIAPFLAASGTILFLMLSGMLGALKIGTYALYALGYAGLLYAYAIKRARPQWGLLLAFFLFFGFLTLRFSTSLLRFHDDFSHWGMVIRHMLRRDRFPGAADSYITFQSYPLGATCFLYYIARAVENSEGICLLAQNLLFGILILPVFSLTQHRKRVLYPLTAALFLLYLSYSCERASLYVDELLVASGIGIAASLVRCRDDLRLAMIVTIPAMIATVYIKNSGMFFSLCSALMLIALARRHGRSSRRLTWILVAVPFAGYLVWTLFIKLHYPSALNTKHAISLLNYAKNLYRKGLGGSLQIAKLMALHFFEPTDRKLTFLGMTLVCCVLLGLSAGRLPAEKRKKYLCACGFSLAVHLVWYLMIACMYIFSMPMEEAMRLAAINRYETTGYSYAVGILAIATLCALQEEEALTPLRRRASAAVSLLGAVTVAALTVLPNSCTALPALYQRDSTNYWMREKFQYLHETYSLPDGGAYICCFREGLDNSTMYIMCAYEFESTAVYLIHNIADAPDQFEAGLRYNIQPTDDLQATLGEVMDQANALLIMEEIPEFEEQLAVFLENYEGNTPVCRAYIQSSTD